MFRRLWFFVMRGRRLRELDEEMRLHVELRTAANRRRGLDADDAASQARRRFGNQLMLQDQVRDAWGFREVERIGGDLQHGLRRAVHHPSRTLVVALTLALGIGATTSIFTLIDTMLLRPAPWNTDGRLVWVARIMGRSSGSRTMSYPDYVVYRDHATTLAGVAAAGGTAMSLGSRQPQRILGGLVSGNFFDVIGVPAQIGRTFRLDEDVPGASPVIVISDTLWREQFAADPHVIGTDVAINGHPFTIIGVARAGFTGVAYADDPQQLWMPLAMHLVAMPSSQRWLENSNDSSLRVVGRLRPDATTAQANAEVRVIARQLNAPGTRPDQEKSARVLAMRGGLTPWEQDMLTPVFGLISIVPTLVLLVACANSANVLMAHYVFRRRELAMRCAIGASRGRLIRQLLVESLIEASLAGVCGFAVSFALSGIIVHYGEVPADVARLLTPDTRALLAAMTVAMATVLLFSLAPALTATKFDVLATLKTEDATSTASRGPARLRRIFITAQVALSLALVVLGGLFFQSLTQAMRVDPGFDPERLVTVSFDLNLQGYAPERRASFVSRFVERALQQPEVMSAAAADMLPFGGELRTAHIVAADGAGTAFPAAARVSAAYFKTLDLPVVRGRAFTEADVAADAPVAMVSETLARRLWPDADPIGQRLRVANPDGPWRTVIGVTRDAKHLRPTESPIGDYYTPLQPQDAATLAVRTAGAPRAALAALSGVAHALDPDLPLFRIETMVERIRRAVNLRRAVVSLLSVLGLVTLVLASVGIYGVAAHNASIRTREVGIRMSLGARGSDVVRMILRENLALSLVGVAVGLAISAAASVGLASFLFGVASIDAASFAGGAVMLCVVSLLASYVPARRAARLDPLLALRRE